jgi:hypothetical protein
MVFDLIWTELRATSASYNGPSNPDALREEIARRVFNQCDGDEIDVYEISNRVLASFGIRSSASHAHQSASQNGGARPTKS